MADLTDLVVKLVRLHDEIDGMESALKDKQKEYSELNRRVTDECEMEKVQSVAVEVDGKKKKVFLRSQFWAKRKEGVDGEAVYDAIAEIEPSLCSRSVNTNSLSAWMREQYEQNPDFEMPEQLEPLVEFKKVTQTVVTGK